MTAARATKAPKTHRGIIPIVQSLNDVDFVFPEVDDGGRLLLVLVEAALLGAGAIEGI